RHGPILSDVYEDLQNFDQRTRLELPKNYAIALRWTALEPTTIFPAFWQANKANNWQEFRTAMSHFDVPSQNAIYADIEGNIGYQMPGKIPIRASGDGKYPVSGWTDEFEWTGYIPFEELPSAYNPQEAYIASANNAVVGPEYPYLIASDWDYGNRARRIVEMIEHRDQPIDSAYLRRMQGDNKNLNAVELVPILLQISGNEAKLRKAVDLLRKWDFQNHMDLAAPALFETFWKHLLAETFHDDFPQDYWPGGGGRWMYVMRRLIPKPDSYWWDNRNTTAKEKRDDIFRAALEKAVDEMEKEQGSDPESWRWGKLHTTTFRNGTLGQSGIKVVERMLNRGPFPTSGGNAIVNATGYNIRHSFEVIDVPSMRMIVDLSDFNKSLVVHTTGQSGHAYHPHYID
ncbi:MAG TPA: penicillin acylase family protein, partial [Acidobacteriota bacterium]|nr:penicillin acylase family protein [Acidobacteriota bacterium]